MPIVRLFVEGKLETELLTPVFRGSPVLVPGGSKYALRNSARGLRNANKIAAGYLRDRDFDFDPPDDLNQPTVDSPAGETPFGWRWCRHEIENYLIEPALVSLSMNWVTEEVEDGIRQAARSIRHYQAARWSIGLVRRQLPPHYELNTKPVDGNDFRLPQSLDFDASRDWALGSISEFRKRILKNTDAVRAESAFAAYVDHFRESFLDDVPSVLLWFSGKDLMAAMSQWLLSRSIPNPGVFRAAIRDWIIAHPDLVLELLPEWNALVNTLRT